MYENQTYEAIMSRVLGRVPLNIDKREGSLIWNGTAPMSLEMSILYTALDFILDATFADTAPREYLIRRAAERGVVPKAVSNAIFRGEFNRNVPIGSRFSLDTLNYVVTERMPEADTPDALSYRVQCETPGVVGNTQFGRLVSIENIDGLTFARLAELLIPGADEEETEAFRARYIASLTSQAFGGNQADYKDKVSALPGVGAVKVFPAWNQDIEPKSFVPSGDVTAWYNSSLGTLPIAVQVWITAIYTAANNLLLTVGGTVKLVIMDSAYRSPTPELIADVQEAIDPPDGHGEGIGLAPIGHVVNVQGVGAAPIDIALTLQYEVTWNWEAAESYVWDAIDEYFLELARDWENNNMTVVRISQIETRVLSCPGMVDITNTLLNGSPENVVLDAVNIPVRGLVSG